MYPWEGNGWCLLSSSRYRATEGRKGVGLISVHVSRRGYQGQIAVVVMHRLDQLPLVVRLPLENDLSWIVLVDEIYRACLFGEREKIIETRARFRSLLNTGRGNWQLVDTRENCTRFGESSVSSPILMKFEIFSGYLIFVHCLKRNENFEICAN